MTSREAYDHEAAGWPELTDERKRKLAELLRPSGKGLRKIDAEDVTEVLDGIKAIGEASDER